MRRPIHREQEERVENILERLLLHGCCEVISSIVQYAVSDNCEGFACPNCSLRVSSGVQCPVNWGLKALIVPSDVNQFRRNTAAARRLMWQMTRWQQRP